MALRERYGGDQVIASDIREPAAPRLQESGPFEHIDVTQQGQLASVAKRYSVDTIYHMAAILSVAGESKPALCWDVNVNGLRTALDVARTERIRLFCPSSIAVFGPKTPRDNTPQATVLRPTTMYGITKVSGELLCSYYWQKFGTDVRGVRYPGIISNVTPPGGGTTDYAVEMFYKALQTGQYTCPVREDTVLPMMYMPDCIRAAIDLMEADHHRLKHQADYNLAAMSFSASELAAEIAKHVPQFTVTYSPDPTKQAIADSWPRTIDDSAARQEWGWQPTHGLETMTADMLDKLAERHRERIF
jgi:nucleoside-diphosphate-sugar epimerase